MNLSNFIFFFIGIILFVVGVLVESNNTFFNDKELAGYLGHFLFVGGFFIFLFQFFIFGIKLLVNILKKVWEQFNDK